MTHTAAQHQGVIRMFWFCIQSTFLSSVIMDLNNYPAQSMYVANYFNVAFIHIFASIIPFFQCLQSHLRCKPKSKRHLLCIIRYSCIYCNCHYSIQCAHRILHAFLILCITYWLHDKPKRLLDSYLHPLC